MSHPIDVTDAEFEEKILQSPTPVVVDFWAPWCGPCRAIAPVLKDLAKEYGAQIVVAKVNTDENPEYAMKFGVQGIPTMLFIRDGQIQEKMVGAHRKPTIKAQIDSLVNAVPN